MVTQQGLPGGATQERQKFIIKLIRERHQTSAEQILEPEFVIGRVICSQVLIEPGPGPIVNHDDNDDGGGGDDEIGGGHSKIVKKKTVQEYIYSYRIELFDDTGDRITGLLRPVLHKVVSQDGLTAGSVVRLIEWRTREARGRNGSEVLYLDIAQFKVVDDEDHVDRVSPSFYTGNSVLGESTGSTIRAVEEQLRRETGWRKAERHRQSEESGEIPMLAGGNKALMKGGQFSNQEGKNQDDYEEDYDDGADLLSGLGSFSTPPAPGAETSIVGGVHGTGTNAVEEPKKLMGNQVPLSALGKRFVDGLDTGSKSTQESSLSIPSSPATVPPMKKARIVEGPSDPTKLLAESATQNQPFVSTPLSRLNISPYLNMHNPGGFSRAAVVHQAEARDSSHISNKQSIWNQLRPCRLADLPSRPHGSKVDVLAVIHSIDDTLITRGKSVKRDCRLVDPSSPPLVANPPIHPHLKLPHHNELKPTILSVWVKPHTFYPLPGTVVAFRGLTVHRYAGRSLNAFSDVAGSVWFLENPGGEIDEAEEVGEWWADICMRELADELERKAERAG